MSSTAKTPKIFCFHWYKTEKNQLLTLEKPKPDNLYRLCLKHKELTELQVCGIFKYIFLQLLILLFAANIWCPKVNVQSQSQLKLKCLSKQHHPTLNSLHLLCSRPIPCLHSLLPVTPLPSILSFLLCPGTDPMCAHILYLQHAILHAEWQRKANSSITHIIYTNKVLLHFCDKAS